MIKRAALVWLAAFLSAGVAWAACDDTSPAEVYPTANVLPENLLRIYIYFPRPMDLGQGIELVRLLDASGDEVERAFLSNRDDLWSPDRRRLTLLLDPGRVKTGLDAHEELGRALIPGQAYTFEVSGSARGADGCLLGVGTRHAFTVAAADYDPPQPALWDFAAPGVSSTDPLNVVLGTAHDHLSLAYRLRVLDADGAVVPGGISLGANEASWHFTPKEAWQPEPYALVIDERLEDLAGNRPGLLFDRPIDQAPLPWKRALPFTPRPRRFSGSSAWTEFCLFDAHPHV